MKNRLVTKTDRAINKVAAVFIAVGTFVVVLIISIPYSFYRAWKSSAKEYKKAKNTYPVKHVI